MLYRLKDVKECTSDLVHDLPLARGRLWQLLQRKVEQGCRKAALHEPDALIFAEPAALWRVEDLPKQPRAIDDISARERSPHAAVLLQSLAMDAAELPQG